MTLLDRSNMILRSKLDYHLTARLANVEPPSMSDAALPIVLGIALAAATGFRVFLPMLIVSAAAYTGHLPLDNSFAWLGTRSALAMLSVAAVAEILAYYIPVIDNLLDSLATPAAFIAGTIVSAAVMTDVPPMVKWTAAVIAGGGIAGITQGVAMLSVAAVAEILAYYIPVIDNLLGSRAEPCEAIVQREVCSIGRGAHNQHRQKHSKAGRSS